MSKGILQAENAIKVGDTKTGFEILRQVLVENPESEKAWWIRRTLKVKKPGGSCPAWSSGRNEPLAWNRSYASILRINLPAMR